MIITFFTASLGRAQTGAAGQVAISLGVEQGQSESLPRKLSTLGFTTYFEVENTREPSATSVYVRRVNYDQFSPSSDVQFLSESIIFLFHPLILVLFLRYYLQV